MKSLFLIAAAIFFAIPSYASLTVSPGTVMFGQVKMNGYNSPRTVQIRNNAQEAVRVQVSGYCQSFQVSNSCYTLSQYGSCTVNIRFAANRPGYHTCSLNVRGSDGSYGSINVSGTAVQ